MKKHKEKRQSTMTFHLWRDFAMFAVIIMAVLWLLQVFFLNAFYESMKKKEIQKIGNEMVRLYNEDIEEFYSYLERNSFKNGVFAHVLSDDGTIIKSPQPMEEFQHRPANRPVPAFNMRNSIRDFNPETWSKFIEKVSASKNNTTAYVINMRSDSKMMVYGAMLQSDDNEKTYLYISSPLQPIDATRRVLQNQLIIVSILSVMASLLLAYYIAKRFSRPIIKAEKSAQRLAEGKYDVHFESGNYREISKLTDVLNEAAKELGKIDELRLDLMANVSHDLKTPLTIIRSYAEMIRDISGNDEEKRNEHTNVIIDETTRLSNLVNDILNLTKIESGISEKNISEFIISDTVKSIIEKFLVYTQKEEFVISADIQDDLKISADKTQIMQVVYNLIGNAINYTGTSKKIQVSLKQNANMVRFEVKDSGDGIPKEELPYVWNRYYRTGRTHTRETTGTGLGLSIVKHILESHGADYGVESQLGEGSTFWFELPLCE